MPPIAPVSACTARNSQAEPREDARVGVVHSRGTIASAPSRSTSNEYASFIRNSRAAHHAEARADLVAELGLDLVEVDRQLPVAADVLARDVGDHFLVRRAEQKSRSCRSLIFSSCGPNLSQRPVSSHSSAGWTCGRVRFERAGAVHLLADDLLDLAQRDAGRAASRCRCRDDSFLISPARSISLLARRRRPRRALPSACGDRTSKRASAVGRQGGQGPGF